MITEMFTPLGKAVQNEKIYIAVVFLIICTGVCVFEQVTINNVYTKTSEIINTALELNERKKFEESKEECKN